MRGILAERSLTASIDGSYSNDERGVRYGIARRKSTSSSNALVLHAYNLTDFLAPYRIYSVVNVYLLHLQQFNYFIFCVRGLTFFFWVQSTTSQ